MHFIMQIFCFIVIAFVQIEGFSYERHKVYRVKPVNGEQLSVLKNLEINSNYDFWSDVQFNTDTRIMVASNFQVELESALNKYGIAYDIIIKNVQSIVDKEKLSQSLAPSLKAGDVSFRRYLRYSEIQNYLARLAQDYPKLVSLENYGFSYEKRNLTGIYISTNKNDTAKPVIFIDGGIHAREWIAPPQPLYLINQILENPENNYLLDSADWVIVPLLNPDGYEYTHTDERFWRKTRSKGVTCDGVDPNRNFDYQWTNSGQNGKECSNTYSGPKPFSEPETLALSKLIKKYSSRTKLYLTYHSAAQCILYPWGYTAELPENADKLHELGTEVEKAISSVHDRRYKVGSSVNVLAYAPGSSRDWAYGAAGISLSYTMELPPGGNNSFDMPPENILEVVKENFEGIKIFYNKVIG